MLEKAEKLERKLGSKPLHHIDTSVIIEPERTLDGRSCKRYLQKLGYSFYGKFSLPVLGELMISLLLLKDSERRHATLDFLSNLRTIRKIGIYTPIEIYEIVVRIKELDTRINLTDADIIACAVEDEANNLVTLDRKLIGNRTIEREFKLRIVHPKDLLFM